MKRAALLFVCLVMVAGRVEAADSDGVDASIDNCLDVDNGPSQLSNQIDTDQDGYGNACDGDFDNDPNLRVTASDYAALITAIACFANPTPACAPTLANLETDLDGDLGFTIGDQAIFWSQMFGLPVGRSGLACAGTVPCLP